MGKIIAISFLLATALAVGSYGSGDNKPPAEGEAAVYELKKGDFSAKFTNWGATLISLIVPDRNGRPGDIALGYASVDEYKTDSTYFGAIVGRVANRIAGAQFTLDGNTYKLVANEGKNILHGGPKGFSDVLWKVKKFKPDGTRPAITFAYTSADGEEGFPGEVKVEVTYTLVTKNQLTVTMRAKADKPTPVNLAQHTYWNLGGHESGSVLSNEIQIFASNYTPVDSELIPTGKIETVKNTPYDFLHPKTIESNMKGLPTGYDINYAVDGKPGKLSLVAIVKDNKSGRVMELLTDQPGVQFYTGNSVRDVKGKNGVVYQPHAGLCLETQGFPDAVNHPNFPSVIVTPDKNYMHSMTFKFSTQS